MDSPILILAVFSLSICSGLTEHGSHTIPVEGYDTELQDLGEHVDVPETPVRVIKITKTVAVKVPVPYPVKVIEKVPYPVHVNRPYPVPVPQIVRVPAAPNPHHPHHEQQIQQYQALDVAHAPFQNIHADGNSYQVQEGSPHDNPQTNDHYEANTGDGEGYSGSLHADYSADGSPGGYYGGSDDGDQDGHNSNVAFPQFNSLNKFGNHY